MLQAKGSTTCIAENVKFLWAIKEEIFQEQQWEEGERILGRDRRPYDSHLIHSPSNPPNPE